MAEAAKGPGHKVFRVMAVLGLLVLLGMAAGAYWFFYMRMYVFSDDARFGGDLVDLAPEIGGTLEQVYLNEGDRVQRGQKAFQLDARVLEASLGEAKDAVESAKAALTTAQARYELAVNGPRPEEIKVAQANEERLGAEEELARVESERTQALYDRGAIPKADLDRAVTSYQAAKLSRSAAVESLRLLQLGTRQEDIHAAQGQLETAKASLVQLQAAVAKAQRELELASVAVPFDGYVARRWLHPGAFVSPGQPVLTVFNPNTLDVEANIQETSLHRVAIGSPVDISVDAFPKLRLKGHVTQILRGANSKFSLVPAEGVSGTFIKVTQRVPLRIEVESLPDLPLGPGLSAEVRIRATSPGEAVETHD